MPDFERMVGTKISWLPKLKIKIIKTYKMQKIRFVLFINDFENKFGQIQCTLHQVGKYCKFDLFSNVSSLRCT